MEPYNHLIKINEKDRTLLIYRVFANNELELFTSVDMPDISTSENNEEFEYFAQQIGENLLMDSPISRKLFKL